MMEASDMRMESRIEDLKNKVKSRSESGSEKALGSEGPPVPSRVGPLLEIESMINFTSEEIQHEKEKRVNEPVHLESKTDDEVEPPSEVTARRSHSMLLSNSIWHRPPLHTGNLAIESVSQDVDFGGSDEACESPKTNLRPAMPIERAGQPAPQPPTSPPPSSSLISSLVPPAPQPPPPRF